MGITSTSSFHMFFSHHWPSHITLWVLPTQVNRTNGLVSSTLIHCCHTDTTHQSTSHHNVRFQYFSRSVETKVCTIVSVLHSQVHEGPQHQLLSSAYISICHSSIWQYICPHVTVVPVMIQLSLSLGVPLIIGCKFLVSFP